MVLLSGSVFVLTKTGVLGEKAKIQWIFGRLLSGRCSVSTPNWWKMWVLVSLSGLRQPAHTRDQASSTLQTASTSSYIIGYWIHSSDKPNRSLRACRMRIIVTIVIIVAVVVASIANTINCAPSPAVALLHTTRNYESNSKRTSNKYKRTKW